MGTRVNGLVLCLGESRRCDSAGARRRRWEMGFREPPMATDHERAIQLFQQAYREQMSGDLEEAVRLYRESLAAHPTAEAHTFLGWTYSFQGKLEEAMAECKRAIEVDPEFGNPYNDIGAYLIDLGRVDEAIPWLERALLAPRYESYHFPHFNLGRAWDLKGDSFKAKECYRRALEAEPGYRLAREALDEIAARMN
jgi:tetratricopeptide (TPR) repeat protein